MTESIDIAARSLSSEYLAAELPRRWRHTQGVAAQARRIASAYGSSGDLLVAAAWLHDIGYTPAIQEAGTGFHPIDGARFLLSRGWSRRLCNLVGRHSCAIREAELRGLADELVAEFDDENSDVRDALWYCDLTTSPDGEVVRFEDRLSEITSRYGPGTVVSQFIEIARPEMTAAVQRTLARVEGAG